MRRECVHHDPKPGGTSAEAMEIVGAAGIPAGAVLDTMELSTDPTFEQRGIMPVIDHPVNGKFKMVPVFVVTA